MQDMDNNLFFFLKTMICYPYESHLKLYMRNAQIIIFMHINHELQLRAKRSSQSSNEITSKHHHPITKQRQSYQQNIIHVILTKFSDPPCLTLPPAVYRTSQLVLHRLPNTRIYKRRRTTRHLLHKSSYMVTAFFLVF